jgi:hypothetical protein
VGSWSLTSSSSSMGEGPQKAVVEVVVALAVVAA